MPTLPARPAPQLCIALAFSAAMAMLIGSAAAQPALQQPGGQQAFALPGQGQGFGPPGANAGAQGGGANADFDSLIDLIISTVAPETWAENGGGEAEIRPFFSGVYADPDGTLRGAAARGPGGAPSRQLTALRREARRGLDRPQPAAGDARRAAPLRCVSLVRLEREIARRMAAGEPLDPAMLTLAGLRRVQYVFVFPPEDGRPGDLALAGPAGDWRADDGRLLAREDSGVRGAVVRLDDLIELFRHTAAGSPMFGCTIDPRPEALAEAQQYIAAQSAKPLRPGRRDAWLEAIRSRVGKQDIRLFNLDGQTRVAGVIVEADHHMKLIGMGLADGVAGVESYLDSIEVRPGEAPPSFGVLRWWFAMNYAEVRRAADGDAFQLVGPGAKVLSENELLTERGGRVPTGRSNELTARFAASFTANFAALCAKHPVYSELRNVFDLSLALAIIQRHGLVQRAGWSPSLLADADRLPLPRYHQPRTVDTVANHRVINRKHVVAGVSGGVHADPRPILADKTRPAGDAYGPLTRREGSAPPRGLAPTAWWWDVE